MESEIIEVWEKINKLTGIKALYDPEFGNIIDNYARKADDISRRHLTPWIEILEQEICWLNALTLGIDERKKNSDEGISAICGLLGTSCVQAVAIRRMCLDGLDLPARAILRGLIETLNTCMFISFDPILREKFVGINKLEDSREIWRKEFSSKKIDERYHELFSKPAPNKNIPELIEKLRAWQKEELFITSQAIHPSYVGALLATYPPPFTNEQSQPGMLGSATSMSIRTISYTCKAIFFFALLGFRALHSKNISTGEIIYEINKENQTDRLVVNGHLVLIELMTKHWGEDELGEEYIKEE